MNTPDSTRVEVTEELLADLEAKARATKGAGEAWTYVTNGLAGRVFGKATAFELGQDTGRRRGIALTPSEPYAAFAVAAQPSVVLALVERIRELESAKEVVAQARLLRSVTCERCGKPFLPQGLGAHRRRCLARSRS